MTDYYHDVSLYKYSAMSNLVFQGDRRFDPTKQRCCLSLNLKRFCDTFTWTDNPHLPVRGDIEFLFLQYPYLLDAKDNPFAAIWCL